ncbi:thiol-disulfide oxidoreductase [Meridianimarinicoccus roseus]|uniref:Thiol-disulfide oxidoreductase n=1 Tax=Meridianimarinicoccus roseus TaxID=2072018 RepID=A0A2V2LBQ3_9RHOB|nr:DsbA family protein [Meridianimarinicoccus roseus]PWR02838.1 thiol-disulfide oxidoreductase [Meridianimarinicoccus roseus]
MRNLFAPVLPALVAAALSLAPLAAPAQEVDTSTIADMALGQADAPVTVIEYASFTCPHCATFHDEVFPDLKRNYIDTGKIRFVHREVYFDRYGLWAGMVARCGGEMRYFGVADQIYERQREWTKGGDPAEVAANLRRIGLSAGLTDTQLDACLSDGEKAQTLVAWYQQNAERDGIEGTPSFIIDGEKHSNMSYADFSALLDEKLADGS